MSDLPSASAAAPAIPTSDAMPAVDPHRIVASVVQSVQDHPDIHPSKAASVITSILAGLEQAAPAIFAVTRASARAQAGVSLGLGLAEIIVGAFLHPPATGGAPGSVA
jgi:hypothetical protein